MKYLWIDIQTRRDCCYSVINDTDQLVKSGWLSYPVSKASRLITELQSSSRVYLGIKSPHMPLTIPKQWFWSNAKREWTRRQGQIDNGPYCEIVIIAHKLAPASTYVLE